VSALVSRTPRDWTLVCGQPVPMHTDLAVIEDTLRRLASVALSPVDQAGCYILASGARNSARAFNVIGRDAPPKSWQPQSNRAFLWSMRCSRVASAHNAEAAMDRAYGEGPVCLPRCALGFGTKPIAGRW